MFIILPSKWTGHPFLKNSFLIRTQDQINKIRKYGFEEVLIDTDKGVGPRFPDQEQTTEEVREESKEYLCGPADIVPEILKEAVSDSGMEPETKARIIYLSSLEIMTRLLEDPGAENISQAKTGIVQVADSIFSGDMTKYLIKVLQHDFNTYTHSVNVGMLSLLLTKSFFKDFSGNDLYELGAGFFLHDLGKARIPQEIINKAGLLTKQEWEVMKTHPEEGHELLAQAGQLSEESRVIVMQHHEKDDGSGYPFGIKGDQIFTYARICRLADVFDALTSWRPYHKKLSTFEALQLMKMDMGFEVGLFEKFVRLFEAG